MAIRFTPASVDCMECAEGALNFAGLDLATPFVVISAAEGDRLDPDMIRHLVADTVGSKVFVIISTPIPKATGEETSSETAAVKGEEGLDESTLRSILGVEEGATPEE
jgi:hypothetical protein